jgi:hypothetical protein
VVATECRSWIWITRPLASSIEKVSKGSRLEIADLVNHIGFSPCLGFPQSDRWVPFPPSGVGARSDFIGESIGFGEVFFGIIFLGFCCFWEGDFAFYCMINIACPYRRRFFVRCVQGPFRLLNFLSLLGELELGFRVPFPLLSAVWLLEKMGTRPDSFAISLQLFVDHNLL